MVVALPPEGVPYFIMKNDLLYSVTFLQGKKVKQLLVPPETRTVGVESSTHICRRKKLFSAYS